VRISIHILILVLAWASRPTFAKLQNIEAAQALSRQTYVQRFTEFTQEKDVMGRPRMPSGKVVEGKIKQSFNPDDQVTFQSDLTYHDYTYDTPDEAFNKKNQQQNQSGGQNGEKGNSTPQERTLLANISPHGASGAGTGSSLLERTVYQLFDTFAKAEAKQDREEREKLAQQGIRKDGPFEIETQKVQQAQGGNNGGSGGGNNANNDMPDKVERYKFNQEAEKKIAEVGDFAAKAVEKAAKDPDKKEDNQAMGNLERYYWAANQGIEAMWNSVMANLGQRRAYQGGNGSSQIELSEDTASCAAWEQKMVSNIKPDDQGKDAKIQDAKKMREQCEQLVRTNFRQINPKMESDQGGQMVMKEKGPNWEDSRQRDNRVQLELMDKVGKRASEVPSNWKYSEADEKALVTVDYDKAGNPAGTKGLRMDEQVDRYNEQLKAAAEKIPDIKSRFPDLALDAKKIESYQIPKKKLSAKEITQFPGEARDPEFEMEPQKQLQPKLADSYSNLIKQGQNPQ
jgi:hypothetical protein